MSFLRHGFSRDFGGSTLMIKSLPNFMMLRETGYSELSNFAIMLILKKNKKQTNYCKNVTSHQIGRLCFFLVMGSFDIFVGRLMADQISCHQVKLASRTEFSKKFQWLQTHFFHQNDDKTERIPVLVQRWIHETFMLLHS